MQGEVNQLPLRDYLKNYDFELEVFEEGLLEYIAEGQAIPDLAAHPDQLLILEDCKRFYFILTGIWPTFK